jgi:hypothetical protein
MVGKLILALADYEATLNLTPDAEAKARAEKCRQAAVQTPIGIEPGNPVARGSAEVGKISNQHNFSVRLQCECGDGRPIITPTCAAAGIKCDVERAGLTAK